MAVASHWHGMRSLMVAALIGVEQTSMPDDLNLYPTNANGETFGIPADPKLIAAGWVRKHLADADRAAESVDLYESMGFEVKARKLTPADFGAGCQDCASTVCKSYVLIYTRKKENQDDAESSV